MNLSDKELKIIDWAADILSNPQHTNETKVMLLVGLGIPRKTARKLAGLA